MDPMFGVFNTTERRSWEHAETISTYILGVCIRRTFTLSFQLILKIRHLKIRLLIPSWDLFISFDSQERIWIGVVSPEKAPLNLFYLF